MRRTLPSQEYMSWREELNRAADRALNEEVLDPAIDNIDNFINTKLKETLMTHRTRDGYTMPINQMEDSHLINTIDFFIKKLKQSKEILSMKETSKFYKSLYNTGSEDLEEQAIEYVSQFEDKIGDYIYEALIRNIDIKEYIKEIQSLIERSARIIITALIEEPKEDED